MDKKMIRKGVWGSRRPAPVDVASILNQPGQKTGPASKEMSAAGPTSSAQVALARSNGSAPEHCPRSAAVSRAGGTSRSNDACTERSEKFEAAADPGVPAAGALTPPHSRAPSQTNIAGNGQIQIHPGEWITTAMAAKLTGYSRRQIHSLCDRGFFIEGLDWKQRPPCPGCRAGGRIRIRRSALKKLETE